MPSPGKRAQCEGAMKKTASGYLTSQSTAGIFKKEKRTGDDGQEVGCLPLRLQGWGTVNRNDVIEVG